MMYKGKIPRTRASALEKRVVKQEVIEAGHQPNYLPWLGFFDKMRQCDVFIIEDNVQFVCQDWHNRNRVKTPYGVLMLTVPVEHVGRPQLFNEVKIANRSESDWAKRHWLTLLHCYRRAPFWKEYCDFFEQTYNQEWTYLIDLNMHIIKGLMRFLGINKRLVMASSLGASGKSSDLIVAQCKALGITTHFSGVCGKDYLKIEDFEKENIKVVFQEFQHPKYPQLWNSDFVPNLSVVDYLFCTGGKWNMKNRGPRKKEANEIGET